MSPCIVFARSGALRTTQRPRHAAKVFSSPCAKCARRMVVRASAAHPSAEPQGTRRDVLKSTLLLSALSVVPEVEFPGSSSAAQVLSNEWERVELPIDPTIVLLDIGFTETDPNHGFLLGTKQTLLETFDGGKTWQERFVDSGDEEGIRYRFNSISFSGGEGWIVGKPAILLHTTDSGANWQRIPLSAKLPGAPLLITAGPAEGRAEMTTDQGAIYTTTNTAATWTAAVQETVDATLNRTVSSGISGASYYEGFFANISRNSAGEYVAVSSRGNFFMTWAPGATYWSPHNRPAARRIQNMGWSPENELWLTTRGGDLFTSPQAGVSESFEQAKVTSRGFGILNVGFKDKQNAFAVGGSGSLYKSSDGGKSWKRDKSVEDVPANLYEVKFFPGGNGFILGNNGVLLKYIGSNTA